MKIELGHDVRTVCFSGLGRDAKLGPDLLIRFSFREELQDLQRYAVSSDWSHVRRLARTTPIGELPLQGPIR